LIEQLAGVRAGIYLKREKAVDSVFKENRQYRTHVTVAVCVPMRVIFIPIAEFHVKTAVNRLKIHLPPEAFPRCHRAFPRFV
jgi:hypothetical protein